MPVLRVPEVDGAIAFMRIGAEWLLLFSEEVVWLVVSVPRVI